MAVNDPTDPFVFHPTGVRGFTYRVKADGSKTFWGYVPRRGRVRLLAATERDARAEWDGIRSRASRGQAPPKSTGNKFREVAEDWYASTEGKQRAWTRKQHRRALDKELLPKLGTRKLPEVGLKDLLALIAGWQKRGLSRSTIQNYLKPVRGTFKYAMRENLVAVNPCTLLDASDIPATESEDDPGAYEWSDEEIDALLSTSKALAAREIAKYDYSRLLSFTVNTGLRLGEVLGLQWRDVDFEAGVLTVQRQLDRTGQLAAPKTKKSRRRVPLTAEASGVLKEHRKALLAEGLYRADGFVFPSKKGGTLSHRNVQRRGFAPAREKAGLPAHVTFHDLRHAFASRAASRGVPVNVLSEIPGPLACRRHPEGLHPPVRTGRSRAGVQSSDGRVTRISNRERA